MHWFWRAVIAVGAGVLWWAAHSAVMFYCVRMYGPITYTSLFITIKIIYQLGLPCICLTVYGLLTRRYYKSRLHVDETRCRKCGYILRGIREPICSECGERI